jgi:dienelactone hydrolase
MNAYASELEEEDSLSFAKTGTETSATKEEVSKREKKIFFETKTMAEVYAKQGYTAIALNIYKRILQKNPSDSEAQKRISELETKLSSRREKLSRPLGDSSKEGIST